MRAFERTIREWPSLPNEIRILGQLDGSEWIVGRDRRGVVKVVNDGLDEILSTPQVAQMVEEREQARALEKPDQTNVDQAPESVPE